MYNLSKQTLDSYASWVADATDPFHASCGIDHARAAGASPLDLAYILRISSSIKLARKYGECHA